MDRTPPPPLPLVLRPPLRKKKSFSRVSSWLNFQPVVPGSSGISILEQQHQRTGSAGGAGSITNAPRPLSGDEGFYQIVGGDDEKGDSPVELRTPVQNNRRHASVDSLSSLSSWDSELDHTATSDEDELEKGTQRTDDNHTVPTSAWSAASPADSSPATKTAHEQMPSPLDASVLDDVPPPTPPKDKDVAQAAVSKGPRPQSVGVAF